MAERPQVLLVAGRFEVRGSSRQVLNLATYLPEAGYRVRILCPDARILSSIQRANLDVMEVSHLESPMIGWAVQRLLVRELAQDPPDLVHVQQRSMLRFGQWLARALDRPMVVSVHDYLGPQERLAIDRHRTRRVIAVSESVRAELIERIPSLSKLVTVIHSGVDVPPEETLREPFREGQTPVVGTAGPLESAKGLHIFLKAIPSVLAEHQPVEFLIAGAGPEEFNLRRMADQLGVTESITFVPNVFDLSTSLAALDVYCLPSLKQGLGTIMLEAMVRGKPVIASRVGGVYGVIADGETGLLVPPSDSQALAGRIVELLRDPARSRALGRAARQRVINEYPVSRMVEQTVAVYRELLETTPPAGAIKAGKAAAPPA